MYPKWWRGEKAMRRETLVVDFPVYDIGEIVEHHGYICMVVKYIYPKFENDILTTARVEVLLSNNGERRCLDALDVKPCKPNQPKLIYCPPNGEIFTWHNVNYTILDSGNCFLLFHCMYDNTSLDSRKTVTYVEGRDKIFDYFTDEQKLELIYKDKPVFILRKG